MSDDKITPEGDDGLGGHDLLLVPPSCGNRCQ